MAHVVPRERHEQSEYVHVGMRLMPFPGGNGGHFLEPYIVETGRPLDCKEWTTSEGLLDAALITLVAYCPEIVVDKSV